jgi:hypothetical protein
LPSLDGKGRVKAFLPAALCDRIQETGAVDCVHSAAGGTRRAAVQIGFRRVASMAICRLVWVLPALLISACSSVQVRGIIRDANGRPIESASVTAHDETSNTSLASATSDANGCFNFFTVVRRDQPRLRVEVSAPRQKPVTLTVDRKQSDPVLVTLVDHSSVQDSGARTPTPLERANLYELNCESIALPGGAMLAPR